MNKRFKSRLNNFIAMFIVFVMVLSTTIVYSATTLNAAENEGEITYTGGLNNGPDIDPFSGEQNSISGSKEATNLTNDESEITISFPAADYKQEYDIVLVVDGSSSFVPLAEHVDDLLNDIGTNLASRENVKINVGVVSYGTIAYENFTPGSGFYWNFFQSCVRTGSCSLASSLLPAEYRDMINYLQPVANFPDTMGTNHYESYRYLLGDATTLKELSSSQDETNPTSVAALYDEVMTNGSDYTVTALLAYAKLTNNSLATQLGYNMDNVVVGTNMEAGLEAGKDMLANGSAPDANKYMVVIGDGGSYLWNADGSDNANNEQTTKDSLQNAIYSRIAYLGQGGLNDFDNKTNPEYYNYSDFEDFLDNSDALTYNSAALSVSQWQAYLADNTINYSTILPNSLNNSTNGIDYKYTSLENGTAHAAEVVKEFANNNEGRLIFLGSLYNPTLHYPGELAYDVTAGFRDYVGSLSDSYYQINDATESDDIVNAFDGIVNRLFYIIDSGNFVDTIGSEFDVVLAGDSIAPSDVKLLVDGSELTGVIDPNNSNVINFGTLDTNTNLYPYTLTYEDGNSEKLTLQINLPVDYSQPLQLKYKVKLNRSTTPGWHENVKLNESAIVNYTDSAGQEGSATFPVPSTNYYVPYDYKVVYDGNGGSGSTVDSNSPYEENSSVTVKDNNFTRDGYTFVSWNTSADGSGTSYAPNATFNITEDTTLYAIWKKIPQAMDVTLKYDTNGASNIKNINSTVYQIGDKVVVKEPEYSKVVSNFKFLGWNTKADGTGTMYQPGDVFTINKDTILYAIYTNTPPLKKTGNDNLYSALIIGLICMSGIAVLVNYRKE